MSPEEFRKFYPLMGEWLQNVLKAHAALGRRRVRISPSAQLLFFADLAIDQSRGR